MTQRVPISVTIITLNEERNLPRLLASVSWADDIVVVDSGSTDQTRLIAEKAGARVLSQEWLGYGQQKNFAQDHAQHDWVLNLDADEAVEDALRLEILDVLERQARGEDQVSGYFLPRKSFYLNRWILHGGWYPNYLVRFARRSQSRWTEPEVHEEWKVQGKVGYFKNPILHYPFRGIADQVQTNLRFSKLGTEQLRRRGKKANLALLILKPIGKFLETYVWKLGFLDGLPGLIISMNAAHSMFLKYAGLFEERWSRESTRRL